MNQISKSMAARIGRVAGVGLAILTLTGCQSLQDGARTVSTGAQDLGRAVVAPFRRSSTAGPAYGSRPAADQEPRDPFLPPPARPDGDEFGSVVPRRLNSVTLGSPVSVEPNNLRLVSKPNADY